MRNFRVTIAFIISILAIVLGAAAAGDYYSVTKAEMKERAIYDLAEEMKSHGKQVENVIEIQKNLLQSVANQLGISDVLGNEEKERQWMESVLNTGEFRRLGIAGTDGMASYTNGRKTGQISISEEEFFTRPMETGKWHIEGPLDSPIEEGYNCFVIGVPIFKDGEKIGVLFGSYNAQQIIDEMLMGWRESGKRIFVSDRKGNIQFGYDVDARMTMEGNIFDIYEEDAVFKEGSSLKKMKQDAMGKRTGIAQIELNGDTRYVIYEALDISEWRLFCGTTQQIAEEKYEFVQTNMHRMILKLVIAAGMILVAAIVLSRSTLSELKRKQKKLEESEERYRILEENSNDVFFEYNLKTKKVFMGENCRRMFGENIDFSTKEAQQIIHPDDREKYLRFKKTIDEKKELYDVEIRAFRRDIDKYAWFRIHAVDAKGNKEERERVVGKIADISLEKAQIDDLTRKAERDFLTGVYNRESMIRFVEKKLEMNPQNRHAFLLFDMDEFKKVNDTYGHDAGDRVLKNFSSILQNFFRKDDVVGRIGGDEFMAFLSGVKDEEALKNRIDQFYKVFRENRGEGAEKIAGCSVGIAIYPEHGKDFQNLYESADLAMYTSKFSGKGKATVYTEELRLGKNPKEGKKVKAEEPEEL